ncbi:zinc finger protein [Trichonephila inaurata madagascariensis]|uniref:Zinc finger protein n=1 Tax=Trichonephila inaurata madagascariensis TaxID=2747483 RepID=A0A8X6Y1L1_9ARAC|nr:zinc finger protein [Trichonephila inaurata madagascariensis]
MLISFSDASYTITHLKDGGALSFCTFCSYSTAYKGNLKTHMLVHTGERRYACSICKKSFSLKACQLRSSPTSTDYDIVVPLHACSYCNYSTPYKTTLMNHVRIHTGERPHSCTVCGFISELNEEGTTYLCSYCSYSSFIKTNIKRHVLVHTGERQHVCSICGYKQRSKFFLNVNESSHPPHSCPYCTYRAWSSNHLKSHLRTHTGERPYMCTVCCKSFVQASHLKTHFRIHSGERPYDCKVCGKTFADQSNFLRHRLVHLAKNSS